MKFCNKCGETIVENKAREENIKKIKEGKKIGIPSINGRWVLIGILVFLILITVAYKDKIFGTYYTVMAQNAQHKDLDKAIQWAEKSYDLNGEKDYLQWLYLEKITKVLDEDYEGARKYLEKASIYIDEEKWGELMAETYMRQAQDEAEDDLEEAILLMEEGSSFSKNIKVRDYLVKLYLTKIELIKNEDIDQAVAYMEKAYWLDPSDLSRMKIKDIYRLKVEVQMKTDKIGALETIEEVEIFYGESEALTKLKKEIEAKQKTKKEVEIVELEPIYDNEFIIPYSDYQVLTRADVMHLTKWELRLARNEIYARHGYVFKSSELARYFSDQSWYVPRRNFKESDLNSVEVYNVRFIKKYE